MRIPPAVHPITPQSNPFSQPIHLPHTRSSSRGHYSSSSSGPRTTAGLQAHLLELGICISILVLVALWAAISTIRYNKKFRRLVTSPPDIHTLNDVALEEEWKRVRDLVKSIGDAEGQEAATARAQELKNELDWRGVVPVFGPVGEREARHMREVKRWVREEREMEIDGYGNG